MFSKKFWGGALILTIIAVIFVFSDTNREIAQSPERNTASVQEAATQPPSPDIYISSDKLRQADTLLVVIKNEAGKVTGKLGNLKLHFFRSASQKNWVAIVGMHVHKKPGNYELLVNIDNKKPFKKTIKVSKRDFPATELIVTPELSEKGYSDQKIIKSIATKENKELKKVFNGFVDSVYSAKPFIYPLSQVQVTGRFGDIRKSKNYSIQHLGVDLKALLGTPLYAVNDGKIALLENFFSYGKTIVIDHGLGVYSIYLHLSDFNVKNGQAVKQGDIIGFAGESGYAIGPHLHFSIKVRGATLDPLKFIETTQNL